MSQFACAMSPSHSGKFSDKLLPDKEFRYLRTVIVTAAVHQGFNSEREPLLLTFWHWAGISPYTSACALAETCVFGKQLPEVFRCGLRTPKSRRQSLSRSYGRCFAEFLNASFLDHLRILISPTGVGLRYGQFNSSLEDFLVSLGHPNHPDCSEHFA